MKRIMKGGERREIDKKHGGGGRVRWICNWEKEKQRIIISSGGWIVQDKTSQEEEGEKERELNNMSLSLSFLRITDPVINLIALLPSSHLFLSLSLSFSSLSPPSFSYISRFSYICIPPSPSLMIHTFPLSFSALALIYIRSRHEREVSLKVWHETAPSFLTTISSSKT